MNRERCEEIKEVAEEFLNSDCWEFEVINELAAALEEEWKKNPPDGQPHPREGRKMAEWKRELRETQESHARLEKQRDELGDSLHNHAPGVPALKGYTPTWARGKQNEIARG